MVTIPVLQIVGFQNSGKTTLMEKIVKACSKEKLKVGTIKHHGHGGIPLLSDYEKDSLRHRDAGAVVTTVEGEGVIELTSTGLNIELETILQMYQLLKIDAVLIEGYKQKHYPKIVLVKNEEDVKVLTKLSHIKAIISWYKIEGIDSKYKAFSIYDDDQYIQWLLQYLRGSHEQ